MTRRDDAVCIVTNSPAPYRLPVFDRLASQYDLTVYFCTQFDDRRHWDPDLSAYGDWYEFLPGRRIGPLVWNLSVYSEIAGGDYDAVLVGDNGDTVLTTATAYVAVRRSDTKFGIWTEGIDTEYYQQTGGLARPLIERFRREMYGRADVCLGYSAAAARWLTERGVPAERIVTGTQVVPESILPPATEESPSSGDLTILSLGNLEQRKGVARLVRSFRRSDVSDARLAVAGDGPLRTEIDRLAREDDRITVHGRVSDSEKASLLADADLFVLPTRHDPWGLVVNEALHYSTPVVVTEMAASSELVERTGAGIVLPDATVETIGDTLERVTADAELLSTLERRASRVTCASDVSVGCRGFQRAFDHLLSA